jgi:hypothetical protein
MDELAESDDSLTPLDREVAKLLMTSARAMQEEIDEAAEYIRVHPSLDLSLLKVLRKNGVIQDEDAALFHQAALANIVAESGPDALEPSGGGTRKKTGERVDVPRDHRRREFGTTGQKVLIWVARGILILLTAMSLWARVAVENERRSALEAARAELSSARETPLRRASLRERLFALERMKTAEKRVEELIDRQIAKRKVFLLTSTIVYLLCAVSAFLHVPAACAVGIAFFVLGQFVGTSEGWMIIPTNDPVDAKVFVVIAWFVRAVVIVPLAAGLIAGWQIESAAAAFRRRRLAGRARSGRSTPHGLKRILRRRSDPE